MNILPLRFSRAQPAGPAHPSRRCRPPGATVASILGHMETAPVPDVETRRQLVTTCHILAASGHNDFVWGHAAARSSDGSGFWIKASGLGLEEVEYDDILLVAWDGTVLQGTGHRHAEYPIHARIMLGRPDVGQRCTLMRRRARPSPRWTALSCQCHTRRPTLPPGECPCSATPQTSS